MHKCCIFIVFVHNAVFRRLFPRLSGPRRALSAFPRPEKRPENHTAGRRGGSRPAIHRPRVLHFQFPRPLFRAVFLFLSGAGFRVRGRPRGILIKRRARSVIYSGFPRCQTDGNKKKTAAEAVCDIRFYG
ncbi:MAG: hypothetical protein CW338_07595 [Clostridiales bacterium]|nr:hypothetical protein [Clostridiales bacterium]